MATVVAEDVVAEEGTSALGGRGIEADSWAMAADEICWAVRSDMARVRAWSAR